MIFECSIIASIQRGHHYPYDSELDSLENREEIHPLTDVTTPWNTRSRGWKTKRDFCSLVRFD